MDIKTFKSIVDLLGKIAPKRNMIPILNNIKIIIHNGLISFYCTDLETEIYIETTTSIPEAPEGRKEYLLPYKVLQQIAKGKNINWQYKDTVTLNDVPLQDMLEEYPAEQKSLLTIAEIIPDNFAERLKLIQPAIVKRGKDSIRFSCFLMEYNGMESDCNLITTDGQQLLISRNLSSNDNKKALVIGTLIPLLQKINPDKILIGHTTNKDNPDTIQFKAQTADYCVQITTKIIDDIFPDWRRIIPEKLEYKMNFTKSYLLDIFQAQKLQDSLKPEEACDKIEISFSTFDLRTIFSKLETLVNFADEEITIQTNGTNHPLIIAYPKHATYTAILVSLRPKEE